VTEDEWFKLIRYNRATYGLPTYHVATAHQAAKVWAMWEHDERTGRPSPPLCRRCGTILRFTERPHQQLHAWCTPPNWLEDPDATQAPAL